MEVIVSLDENNAGKNLDMNESTCEGIKESYCKEITPILVRIVNDKYNSTQVEEELELDRLNREHKVADEKIGNLLKEIEGSQKKSDELDRHIYDATQKKAQTLKQFKRTGEMLKILNKEREKIKYESSTIEAKRETIAKRVEKLKQSKEQKTEYIKNIENLEEGINRLLSEPEPKINENLIKENEELKIIIKEKQETLEKRREKEVKAMQLKKEQVNLLKRINKKQDENTILRIKADEQRKQLNNIRENVEKMSRDLEENLENSIKRKEELLERLKNITEKCEENQMRMDEKKNDIVDTESKLAELKLNILIKQQNDAEKNDQLQNELQLENNNLAIAEKNLLQVRDENASYLSILGTKRKTLNTLKSKQEELTNSLCDIKIKVVTQECKNELQQHNVDLLSEQIKSEKLSLEEIKQSDNLDSNISEAKSTLENFPKCLQQEREKLTLDHDEKIKSLLNQQNYLKASMDFIKDRLKNSSKEAETLRHDLKELEESVNFSEMNLDRQKVAVNSLKEKAKQKQIECDKLRVKLKEKEQKLNDFEFVEIMETVTVEEEQVEINMSGRKSPGILKSPSRSPKRPSTPAKKVKFEGLSSTESSVNTVESLEVDKQLEDNISDFLKDWKTTDFSKPKTPKRRQKMD